jgi:hypothetical protein
VGRRSDQGFQIVVSGTQHPLSRQVFVTVRHCLDAAVELEEIFDFGGLFGEWDDVTREQAEAIVRAHALRERVELELGQKQSSESL